MKLFKDIRYSKNHSVFCKDLNFIKVEYNVVCSINIYNYGRIYKIYFYITTLEEINKLHFSINVV